MAKDIRKIASKHRKKKEFCHLDQLRRQLISFLLSNQHISRDKHMAETL